MSLARLLCCLMLLPLPVLAAEGEVGFYAWHLPPGHAAPPNASEYRPLHVWAPGGSPELIDVVLDGPALGPPGHAGPLRLQITVELQLRHLIWGRDATPLDPYAEREDPQWHRYLQKTITVKGFEAGKRIHLVSALALGKLLRSLAPGEEWPLALRVDVLVLRRGEVQTALHGTLPILP